MRPQSLHVKGNGAGFAEQSSQRKPLGRLKVVRLLPATSDAPEGSLSTEPDRGGSAEPFHAGDRVRLVTE